MRTRRKQPYPVVVTQEGRWHVARCAAPAITSQGRTLQEALANIREAIELYIESFGPGDIPHSEPVLAHVAVAV